MTTRNIAALLATTAFLWSGASIAQEKRDIVETATQVGNFKTLTKAIDAAGLTEVLKSGGPFTVFAPTDDAFAKLPPGELDKLMADKGKLAEVLKGHVSAGEIASKDVKEGSVTMANGKAAKVTAGSNGVSIDGARVVKADVPASNGVIHVIDKVIVPK